LKIIKPYYNGGPIKRFIYKLTNVYYTYNQEVIDMYGKCETYGKRLKLTIFKIRKGFIPLFISKGLAKELCRNGLCN